METFFTATLPSILNTYAQYRLTQSQQQAQIKAAQAAQTVQYTQSSQSTNLVPILLVGGALLAFVVITRK